MFAGHFFQCQEHWYFFPVLPCCDPRCATCLCQRTQKAISSCTSSDTIFCGSEIVKLVSMHAHIAPILWPVSLWAVSLRHDMSRQQLQEYFEAQRARDVMRRRWIHFFFGVCVCAYVWHIHLDYAATYCTSVQCVWGSVLYWAIPSTRLNPGWILFRPACSTISTTLNYSLLVVPHKAVAEVSKIGNL